MKGKVSSCLMRKRGQFAQGYVLLAVSWVPVWPFVPDTSPTINCFIQLECVSFLTAHGVCIQRTSKGMKGWRNGVEVTCAKQVSIPVIYICFTFRSLSLTWSAAMQISWKKRNFFYKRKDFNSTGRFFNLFCLLICMAAETSYENSLWFKYSSLPLYCYPGCQRLFSAVSGFDKS